MYFPAFILIIAATEKGTSPSLRCTALPVEVWTRILYMYCGALNVPPAHYNKSREELRVKNADWRRLIDSTSLFWFRVAINIRSINHDIQQHVSHISGRAMKDVFIDFNIFSRMTDSAGLYNGTHPLLLRSRALIALIAPTSRLWRHVSIKTDCIASAATIPEVFFLPLLRNHTPNLSHLHLFGIPLPLGSETAFASLARLEITNVAETLWPTSDVLIRVLTSCKRLNKIAFQGFGVTDPDAIGVPRLLLVLMELHTLELIKSKGTNSILSVLHHASMPALRHLVLRAFRGYDYSGLRIRLKDLERVHTLLIRTRSSNVSPEHAAVLLRGVPNLVELNIGNLGQCFVDALALYPETVANLHTLTVRDACVHTLHEYVMNRANYKTVELTIYFFTDDMWSVSAGLIADMESRLFGFYFYQAATEEPASSLALTKDLNLGSETSVDDGRLLNFYVDGGGYPLQVLLVGVVADVVEYMEGIKLIVLIAPDETYPVTRAAFHQQTALLDRAVTKDRLDMSRRVLHREMWSQGPAEFCDGAIFIRIVGDTEIALTHAEKDAVDLSTSTLENFYPFESEIGEAPVIAGDVLPMERGALIICNVSPLRVDLPMPTMSPAHAIFSRTVRIFRSLVICGVPEVLSD
ncbi:hypothetical protein B0H11DRAFT_1936819 [Mycena galericulata]|nr:hypothetical protein B0H11DRAFT_1936819 [Mycena galericulata]